MFCYNDFVVPTCTLKLPAIDHNFKETTSVAKLLYTSLSTCKHNDIETCSTWSGKFSFGKNSKATGIGILL